MISATSVTWDTVIKGMIEVVEGNGTGATAFRRFPYPVKIAGKTGSVQLGPGQGDAHGWFGGFAPVENPEIVIVAFVEHGGGGATAAAPIVRQFLEGYFRRQYEPEGEGES